jgi:ABC-2 type transport system permease protein
VQRVKHLIKKEFRQIRRDRAMLMIIFVVPVVQLLILGYIISSEVKNIPTVIVDSDRSQLSRELIAKIEHSGLFYIKYVKSSPAGYRNLIDSGKASIAIVIPPHFSRDINLLRRTSVQIILDGQDANTSAISLGYINGIIRDFIAQNLLSRAEVVVDQMDITPHFVETQARFWYNPNLEYKDYMVPGIAAFLLTLITTLLSAMGLVREREVGTLEQLLVSPIKKNELLIGKIIPFAILGFFELAIALAFARLWYEIPIVGNLGVFIVFTIIYLFTTLGLGLFISASAHTQQQAIFMAWFIMIFAFLMSGFIFPIENMPKFTQWLSYLNPLRYFMLVIREIFVKGATFKHLLWQGVALVIFSASIFSLAVAKFQQRMK